MRTTYELKKGSYFVGDPALITIKSDEGEAFLQSLWKEFYKNPNQFQLLQIKGVKFLVSRTEGGDGIFNGIGTDTGVIMILPTKYLGKKIFKKEITNAHYKILSYDHQTKVSVENFNIYFEDFEIITN
ncbi:MAG: hypothetical protein AB7E61_07550 [Acholeplasmataceae bacterium]